MNEKRNRWLSDGKLAWLIIIAILVIDQIIKIEVKTSMTLGESIHITDWFYIAFIENNGMAWGMSFGNKLLLSIVRILAVTLIGLFVWQTVKQRGRTRYIVFLSMVMAGAAGNIFDSMFYGQIFTVSTPFEVARPVPFGEGYAGFLMGKVVDMFYFPLIHTTWPEWMPFWGGEEFIFFSPIFNFADSCITVGVLSLLLFCRKDLELMGDTVNIALKRKTPEQVNAERQKAAEQETRGDESDSEK